MMQEVIGKLVLGESLTEAEAQLAMGEIMAGRTTPAQVAAFLTALRMKGESVDEIVGCAKAMRAAAVSIRGDAERALVDIVGTGGDGAHTYNISTTSAFIVAGTGTAVAKHGNRSVSSRCGSADVLEALGVNVDLAPEHVERCLHEVGMAFLYAPVFHRAMRHAAAPRKEIGVRTIFNILGPLTNPAGATAQLVGVYDAGLTEPFAEVLGRLGVRDAFVVHGLDGLDEMSLAAPSKVSRLTEGRVETYTVEPEEVGLQRVDRDALTGGDVRENAEAVRAVLAGEPGPKRDVALLNAAAALVASGAVGDLREGVEQAARTVDSGEARERMEEFAAYTRKCA